MGERLLEVWVEAYLPAFFDLLASDGFAHGSSFEAETRNNAGGEDDHPFGCRGDFLPDEIVPARNRRDFDCGKGAARLCAWIADRIDRVVSRIEWDCHEVTRAIFADVTSVDPTEGSCGHC